MNPRQVIEQCGEALSAKIEGAMREFHDATGYDVEVTGNSIMNATTYNKAVRYKLVEGMK